ncbi:hypothetical protein BV22DRAFT_1134373 [Leucogyrophana mollusca]|uniref:Uncharacterized protein n=1 Tax=Leucogyrophana mollusca TaxID=85980 RepID=A0ACB8B0U8_9AGAM|nr:hypothetical protein BV22DRAFT_1134373 [Leucogyrophana mollusca]
MQYRLRFPLQPILPLLFKSNTLAVICLTRLKTPSEERTLNVNTDPYEPHSDPNLGVRTQAASTAVNRRQAKLCRAQVDTLSIVPSVPSAETNLQPAEACSVDAKAGANAKPGAGPPDAKLRVKTAVCSVYPERKIPLLKGWAQVLERLQHPSKPARRGSLQALRKAELKALMHPAHDDLKSSPF